MTPRTSARSSGKCSPATLACRARRALRTAVVVMGVPPGGPQALKRVIPRLPATFPVPVAIVLHMPVGFTEPYARSLGEASPLAVSEARHGDQFLPGMV